jgi:phosphoribosylanthranilate isomerase
MRVKICGITQSNQAEAIARMGVTALGFICVPTSRRFVGIKQIQDLLASLTDKIDKIGVFANAGINEISEVVMRSGLTGIQLHGDESPEFCSQLRQVLPNKEIIKAIRIRDQESLNQTNNYIKHVDTLLLDAYHPQQLGGTGQTLDWQMLAEFRSTLPWFLAGGLTPNNILDALHQLNPHGIDLSSGVERSPGDKDLAQVAKLMQVLRRQEAEGRRQEVAM